MPVQVPAGIASPPPVQVPPGALAAGMLEAKPPLQPTVVVAVSASDAQASVLALNASGRAAASRRGPVSSVATAPASAVTPLSVRGELPQPTIAASARRERTIFIFNVVM
jgi:hypothetical protein